MSSPNGPAADDELQFHTAEPAAVPADAVGGTQGCAQCQKPIMSEYYAIGSHAICADCRTLLDPPRTGTRFKRLFKAGALGLAAGLVGAVIWYAVRRITDMEIGLIAILVGFMVGKAVRVGSGHRGGRGYQVMAVILTYCCIAANYIPDIVQVVIQEVQSTSSENDSRNSSELASTTKATTATNPSTVPSTSAVHAADATEEPPPRLLEGLGLLALILVGVFALAMAAPFLMGAQNIIGLLIIAFALWEAWKLNRRALFTITGPYQLGDRPLGDAASGTNGSAA